MHETVVMKVIAAEAAERGSPDTELPTPRAFDLISSSCASKSSFSNASRCEPDELFGVVVDD